MINTWTQLILQFQLSNENKPCFSIAGIGNANKLVLMD